MPKKPHWDWDDVGVGRTYRKTWDELGITPEQFRTFREASHQYFTTGKKSESDRIWSLLKAGHTIRSLSALANDDIQEYSSLLGCLLELTDRKLPNSRDALKGVRSYLELLPDCDPVEVVNWMQLLSSDELILLEDAGFIAEGLETVASALQQIQERVKWLRAAQIKLLAELPKHFTWNEILFAVENDRLGTLASQLIMNSNDEQEAAKFVSGKYGDWRSLGVSFEQMHEIVNDYYEPADFMDAKVTSFYKDGPNNALFADFKNLLKSGWSVPELLNRIRSGFTADDVREIHDAGLPITQANLDEWNEIESAVILFLIDNGFTRKDREGGIFEDWMPSASLILPWWEFCKKKGWIDQFTRSQLLYGLDPEDAQPAQTVETRFDETITELLSLEECLKWEPLREKFDEIQKWRLAGFSAKPGDYSHGYKGFAGHDDRNALAWRHFKFTPNQALAWFEALRIGPLEASMWHKGGIKLSEVQLWISVGIRSPSEAARWVASGANPQVAQARKKAGITPPNLN